MSYTIKIQLLRKFVSMFPYVRAVLSELYNTTDRNIGPLNTTIHEGLEWPLQFNSLSVCSPCVTNFLILLQHNIRPPSCNCIPCAP